MREMLKNVSQLLADRFNENLLRKLLLITVFTAVYHISHAQIIRDKRFVRAKKKWKVIGSFDGRRSLIIDQTVNIGGIRLGVQFKNNFRFGNGIYGFQEPIKIPRMLNKPNLNSTAAQEYIDYTYITWFFEPILYRFRRWQFSIPVCAGQGNATTRLVDNQNLLIKSSEKMGYLAEAAFYAENKVFWWIGIGSGIGYRRILTRNIIDDNKFNGPYYQLAVKLYLGQIARRVFAKKDKPEEDDDDD